MASRAYGEISAECFEPYGRWGSIHDHPRRLELWGLLSQLTCHEGSTMIGLYVMPLWTIARTVDEEAKLRELILVLVEHGIVRWDEKFNLIYIVGAILDQMNLTAGHIKPKDKRLRAVKNQLAVLERLVGRHEFIEHVRATYILDSSDEEKPKPLRDSAADGTNPEVEQNSSGKGHRQGAWVSPPAPAPAPASASDLGGEDRGAGEGEELRSVPRFNESDPFSFPASQYEASDGVRDYGRSLGLSDTEIDETLDEYRESDADERYGPCSQGRHVRRVKRFLEETARSGGRSGGRQGTACNSAPPSGRGRAAAQQTPTRRTNGEARRTEHRPDDASRGMAELWEYAGRRRIKTPRPDRPKR